jgi:hypothetical protein
MDERSVVQTRFATTALAMLPAHLGEDLTGVVAQAERVLAEPLPQSLTGAGQFSFLGTGWSVGIANEAALKFPRPRRGRRGVLMPLVTTGEIVAEAVSGGGCCGCLR